MKPIIRILYLVVVATVSACSETGGVSAGYDEEVCRSLSLKIEGRDSLTQRDYAEMIEQDEAILQYLVDCSKKIASLPEAERAGAWRNLVAEPEYLSRFGYMFTIGSSLFRADNSGKLNEKNAEAYRALDCYNEELAEYSDR